MFLEYKELIERPHVKDQLAPECQALMTGLKTWLHKLEASLNAEIPIKESNEDIPETLQEIYATRQFETQVAHLICTSFAYKPFIDGCWTGDEDIKRTPNFSERQGRIASLNQRSAGLTERRQRADQ